MTQSFTIQEVSPQPILTFEPRGEESSNITLYTNQSEMLRVAEDGFYVRGKKLDIDDEEARSVYKAFRQWLIWTELIKD